MCRARAAAYAFVFISQKFQVRSTRYQSNGLFFFFPTSALRLTFIRPSGSPDHIHQHGTEPQSGARFRERWPIWSISLIPKEDLVYIRLIYTHFSLVQEQIHATRVHTYSCHISVLHSEFPPAYSRRYAPACQLLQLSHQYPGELPHWDKERACISVVQVPWQLHSEAANKSWEGKREKQTAASQLMAWGKHKRP